MATKLKKHNPFLAFLIYFLSLSIFLGAAGVITCVGEIRFDYKDSLNYRWNVIPRLLRAGYLYTEGIEMGEEEGYSVLPDKEEARRQAQEVLSGEGGNVAYLLISSDGTTLSYGTEASTPEQFLQEMDAQLASSQEHFNRMAIQSSDQGYDHFLVARGNDLYEKLNTRTASTVTNERSTSLAMSRYGDAFYYKYINELGNLGQEKTAVCLAIRAEGAFANNYGMIYNAYYHWYQGMMILLCLVAAAFVSLLVFLAVRLKKQSLEIARAKLAAFTGWFWIECKALVALLFGGLLLAMALDAYGSLETILFLYIDFWLLWLFVNDLRRNGKAVFAHNIPSSVKRILTQLDSKYPFCARMKKRFLFLILVEAGLMFLSALLLLASGGDGIGVVMILLLAALGLFLLICYIRMYNKDIDAFAESIDYVAKIRAGTATEPLNIPAESAFAPLAADLNDIHSGMTRMVDERVRSEQMKVELITNVSHDLKTPLTSIINYIDLLGKEMLTPDYANDYVKVLEGKAERLKNLVQDLFEISKANSGAIDLNLEQLSVQSLIEQTVAELDQRTAQAGVEIKLQLCEASLNVRADGKKLHRVFENLLGNALKYSLAGTRVYISVTQEDGDAQVIFKNVAGYEMTFTADEIVERFQRGDASRTSEGSGLGLAIAKSFLELNGGGLRIELDGDLFKAIVRIPLYVPYAQRAVDSDGSVGAELVPAQSPAGTAGPDDSQDSPAAQKAMYSAPVQQEKSSAPKE